MTRSSSITQLNPETRLLLVLVSPYQTAGTVHLDLLPGTQASVLNLCRRRSALGLDSDAEELRRDSRHAPDRRTLQFEESLTREVCCKRRSLTGGCTAPPAESPRSVGRTWPGVAGLRNPWLDSIDELHPGGMREKTTGFTRSFLASLRDALSLTMQPGVSKTQPLATIFDASGVRRSLLR